MDKKLIARKIRQYRHLEKLSQEMLATKVGVSDTYIRKLEAGDRTPSLEMLVALAGALNTTPDHLLLSASHLDRAIDKCIIESLSDCTTSEFTILFENMIALKDLLRTHLR